MGDGHLVAEGLHAQEGDHLVVRALSVELQLAVLVGYTQGFYRRLADVDGFAHTGCILAQAFSPQLAEPIGHILETVSVGHHNVHVDASLLHQDILDGSLKQGGILPHVMRRAARVHRGRAG
ncbi:hypothetical protein SDC9_187311 [bioreactor metagenome]|uniref:Uncharacterized protein n=1 Tax=bioreactor metagenome TaxID=1076179 RepID=A0A645HLA9_9ZZZZ